MNTLGFFRIRLSTIRPEKETNFNIYILVDGRIILYLKAGDKMSSAKVHTLHRRDTGDSFFVKNEDKPTYRAWIKAEINSNLNDPISKAQILRESSLAIIEDLFENPDINMALDESRPVIKDFMSLMDESPEAMQYLLTLSGHDFYTYNHSLDVGIYSLGLAKELGFGEADLEELGVSALFHDIGKRNVQLDILCKSGPLSEAEWEQMRKHPQYGLIILNENPNISDAMKAACYEHHESWSGNGYPQQLVGNEIHPFARIVAITDTYDAMTTQRSYNVPMRPAEAITMMKEKLAGRYDPAMLRALQSILSLLNAA